MSFVKRPGQERSADSYKELENLYAKWGDDDRVAKREEAPEEVEAKKDPLYAAKRVAEDLVRAFMVLAEDQRLGPAEMIFAMELAAQNVMGATDCPLTAAQIAKVRGKAANYYTGSLPAVPNKP